jgi:hypothetical protein
MIKVDFIKFREYHFGSYHISYRFYVYFTPSLFFPYLSEQIRKALSYRQAVTLNNPDWNGERWVEYDPLDDIPF